VESSLHLSSLVLLLLREMRLLRPYSSRLHCHTSDKIHPKQDHILGFGHSKIISKYKHSAERRIGIIPTTFWKQTTTSISHNLFRFIAKHIKIAIHIYIGLAFHTPNMGFGLTRRHFLSASHGRNGKIREMFEDHNHDPAKHG
jgi:hypothetical protein